MLFKHHQPLEFSLPQLTDFLAVSDGWFQAAATTASTQQQQQNFYGFFIWNCGPRAGASQYHGHGQLMLTRTRVPAQARLDQQAAAYGRAHACSQPAEAVAAGVEVPGVAGGAASSNGGSGGGSVDASYYRDLVLSHHAVGLVREICIGERR